MALEMKTNELKTLQRLVQEERKARGGSVVLRQSIVKQKNMTTLYHRHAK